LKPSGGVDEKNLRLLGLFALEKVKLDETRYKKHMTQATHNPPDMQASTFTFHMKQSNTRYDENRSEEGQLIQGSIDELNYELASTRRSNH